MLRKILAKLPKRKPSQRHRLTAGQSVTLTRPGGAGHVVLAVDPESFGTLAAARRLREFTALREAGKLFIVPNGTAARVLEVGAGRALVFVTDGPMQGRSGWAESRHANPER